MVTATRTPEANAPSKVTVIEGAAIRDSKALDEALRADPSFGLFRRNSSLVADPFPTAAIDRSRRAWPPAPRR